MSDIKNALELLKNFKVKKPLVGIVVNPWMLGELIKLPDKQTKEVGLSTLRGFHHSFYGTPIYCKTTQKKAWIPFYNKKGMEKYLARYEWINDLRVISSDDESAIIGAMNKSFDKHHGGLF